MLPSPRRLQIAARALLLVVGSFSPVRAGSAQEVLVQLRHPDGREESVKVSDFRFVFYERRFIRHPTGIGKKGTLEVRDLPREARALWTEKLRKVKFSKLRRLEFPYRESKEGPPALQVMALRRNGETEEWPVSRLRNAAYAKIPHFRGVVSNRTIDFELPPVVETEAASGPVVVRIDFEFPGQKPSRKWF